MTAQPKTDPLIEQIKERLPLSDLVGKDVKLTPQKNGEQKGLCPFHTETTASFYVNDQKGFFNCFGCGAHGDVFDWASKYLKMPFPEAKQYLAGLAGLGNVVPLARRSPPQAAPAAQRPQADDTFAAIIPPPADAPPAPTKGWDHIYPVRALDGTILRYTVRRDARGGKKKDCRGLTYGTVDGKAGWHLRHAPAPRHLHGLDLLAVNQAKPVIVVEGEKKQAALQAMLPTHVVVTWTAGSKAIHKSDWTPLRGRKVIIWPDNDDAGASAAREIAALLHGHCPVLKLVDPSDLPPKHDCADLIETGVTADELRAWVKVRLSDYQPDEPAKPTPPTADEPPPNEDDRGGGPPDAPPPDDPGGSVTMAPAPLGYDRGTYFYLSKADGQVHALTAHGHTKNAMISMAPLRHWESTVFVSNKGGVLWDAVADHLMGACRDAGPFDPEVVRGRGVWDDNGRVVIHTGRELIVDGELVPCTAIRSRFVYERRLPIHLDDAPPISNADASNLIALCQRLGWANPLSAHMLAGWIVAAHICGALNWRPSIWLIGKKGTGKTWTVDGIIRPILGRLAVSAEGDSTAKGIEQYLSGDSLPVVFDEAEGDDESQQGRIQSILSLLRSASSSGQGRMLKGTVDGKGRSTSVRTMFAFSSINPSIQHAADASRITQLLMERSHDAEAFEETKRMRRELLTPEWIAGLRGRIWSMVPTILANVSAFREAAADHYESARVGDQIGTLLGCAYSLTTRKPIDSYKALEWIEANDLGEMSSAEWMDGDERCWGAICAYQVRVQTSNQAIDRTIWELILAAKHQDDRIDADTADQYLRRHGIRAEWISGRFFASVASSHSVLERMLRGTPWAKNWATALRQLKGALPPSKRRVRFGAVVSAVVSVPVNAETRTEGET